MADEDMKLEIERKRTEDKTKRLSDALLVFALGVPVCLVLDWMIYGLSGARFNLVNGVGEAVFLSLILAAFQFFKTYAPGTKDEYIRGLRYKALGLAVVAALFVMIGVGLWYKITMPLAAAAAVFLCVFGVLYVVLFEMLKRMG
jgi:hypothetical protein